MSEFIDNYFIIFWLFSLLAMYGLTVIFAKVFILLDKAYKEAEERKKMVEFAGIVIGIISFIIALLSLVISYSQNSKFIGLDKRVSSVENIKDK